MENNISEKIKYLTLPFSTVFKRIFFIKFLFGVMGLLGLSSLLCILTEYATYSYSSYYGLRVPCESIPYRSFTFAQLILFVAFFCGYVSAIYITAFIPRLQIFESFFKNSFTNNIFFKCYIIFSPLILLLPRILTIYNYPIHLNFPSILFAIIAIIFCIPFLFLNIHKDLVLPHIATLIVTISILYITLIYTPNKYAVLLRAMRIGGGIEVEVAHQKLQHVIKEKGFLMLKTNTSVFLFSDYNNSITEIPLRNLILTTHKTKPKYKLPPPIHKRGLLDIITNFKEKDL